MMANTRGRRLRSAAAVLAVALLATACGGPAPSRNGDDADVSGTIRLLTPIFEGADGQKVLDEQLGAFKSRYPKATVEVDYTSYGKLNEKLTTSIASGRPYDVMLMGVGWIPPFAAKGALAELNENASELKQRYNERVVEPYRSCWTPGSVSTARTSSPPPASPHRPAPSPSCASTDAS